jgi:ATP phosphoribosyltransferase
MDLDQAEAVADITSTGETLRANHLKILQGSPIHQSQATLFAARGADWSSTGQTLQRLSDRLGLPMPTGFSAQV